MNASNGTANGIAQTGSEFAVVTDVLLQYIVSLNGCYVTSGGIALITNLTVLGIMISDFKNLIMKWPTVAALIIGNISNSLHAFINGVYRLINIYMDNRGTEQYTVIGCFFVMASSFLVTGYVIPTVVQCCIGLERVVAICAFKWYRSNWSPKKTWCAVAVAVTTSSCIWLFVGWYGAFTSTRRISRDCSSSDALGLPFIVILYKFEVTVGTLAVLLTLVALYASRYRISKMTGNSTGTSQAFKKQIRIARMMAIVALMDFGLVTLPSFLLVLQLGYAVVMPGQLGIAAVIMFSLYSTANIVVCVMMNGDIRDKMLAFGKKFSNIFCRYCCGCGCGTTVSVTLVTSIVKKI